MPRKRYKPDRRQTENAQLRRAISDLTLDDPREGCKRKLLSPARRGSCIAIQVESVRATGPPCARTATPRRVPTGRDDEERLTADIVELAHRYGRSENRGASAIPARSSTTKRVERIWRFEGLKVPAKQPKRGRL